MTVYTTIQKVDFDNDTLSTLADGLDVAMYSKGNGNVDNHGVASYLGGGTPSSFSPSTSIEKLDFTNDSVGAIAAVLSEAVYVGGGTSNTGTAGYWAGGATPSATDGMSKIGFSDDAMDTITATLSASTYYLSGRSNHGTAGYWDSGYRVGGAVDKTDFTDDSTAAIAATHFRWGAAGVTAGTVCGYIAGGGNSGANLSYTDDIAKLLYSDDSISTGAATMSVPRILFTGCQNSAVA